MSDRIAEIRERMEKATPGPWGVIREIDSTEYGDFAVHGVAPIAPLRWYSDNAPAHTVADPVERFEDAEFIAHSPDDIAFLLSRLSAITDALEFLSVSPPAEVTEEMVRRAESHLREWYERDGNLRWIVPSLVLGNALEVALGLPVTPGEGKGNEDY